MSTTQVGGALLFVLMYCAHVCVCVCVCVVLWVLVVVGVDDGCMRIRLWWVVTPNRLILAAHFHLLPACLPPSVLLGAACSLSH